MQLGLIGAGNMASALARAIGEPVLVSDAVPDKAEALAAELGGEALASNAEVAERADLLVLCHKPVQLAEVAEQVEGHASAVASILAATRIADLEAAYPDVPVYRFMPNLPAQVGQGVLCYARNERAGEHAEDEVLELFGRAGEVFPLDEELIEPAMAVMSCSPAFFARVVEALTGAGAGHGLEPEAARRMVVQTMAGTATLLRDVDPGELQRRVATPGGATERGLNTLEEHGLTEAFTAAVDTIVEGTRR